MGTVHHLSLHYSKQHLDSTYRGFLSIQARAAGYALTNLTTRVFFSSPRYMFRTDRTEDISPRGCYINLQINIHVV
jgi:hypothetical protein